MNYLIIQQTGDAPKEPPKVVQMFTDKELFTLGKFLSESIDSRNVVLPEREVKVASTLLNLLQQWENETQ